MPRSRRQIYLPPSQITILDKLREASNVKQYVTLAIVNSFSRQDIDDLMALGALTISNSGQYRVASASVLPKLDG